jgi:hypothetical protein
MQPDVSPTLGVRRYGALLVLLAAATCSSAAQRTFVSGSGSDANACSFAAPCRSFGAALAQTDPAGEIVALDSAGYGPVTIGKSVAIVAPPGVHAGVTAGSGQSGIVIDGSGIDVTLRGLAINGQASSTGIEIVAASHVYIERCVVAHAGNDGIRVALPLGSAGKVRIVDSTARANSNGVKVTSGNVAVVDSRIDDNGAGGIVVQGGRAAVQRSSMSGNGNLGLYAAAPSGPVFALVSDSVVAHNGLQGIGAGAGPSATTALIAHANAISDTNPSCGTCNGINGYSDASGTALVAASRNVVTRSGGRGMYTMPYVTFHTYGDNLLNDNAGGSKIGTFLPTQYE